MEPSQPNQPMRQRTPEWHAARRGHLTASRFSDLMTGGKTAESYLLKQCYELVTGKTYEGYVSYAMRRGSALESEAFRFLLEGLPGSQIQEPVGEMAFVKHPSLALVGCSPDGFVGEKALVQIKCPENPAKHLWSINNGKMPEEHKAQVQGELWVTGRSQSLFISYDPRFKDSPVNPMIIVVVERDEAYLKRLETVVTHYHGRLISLYSNVCNHPF